MSAVAPAARPGAHRLHRPASTTLPMARMAVSVAVLLVCAAVLGQLVGAVRAEAASHPASPVSITAGGRLDTAGLAAGGTTVSTMTVTNTGDEPARWAAYPRVEGTPEVAGQLVVTAYFPGESGCAAPGAPVPLRAPSATPLAPGQSATVCLVMSLPESAVSTRGSVTPTISFVGTPAA